MAISNKTALTSSAEAEIAMVEEDVSDMGLGYPEVVLPLTYLKLISGFPSLIPLLASSVGA